MPRILVAPLNWGLGHATRCIPIVHELQKQGAEVLIGSDGAALALLKEVFPELESLALPPYNVRYKYSNMFLNIAPQLPKLLQVLTLERRFLQAIISTHKIDALISDNRYGLYSNKIPSIFITHQLQIKIGNPLVSAWINRMNRYYMKQYDKVWVPDLPGADNLSGLLGHGIALENLQYIGPLSRLEKPETPSTDYDIVAILSGPEPQRSYFEEKLKQQLSSLTLKSLLVQGIAGGGREIYRHNEYLSILPFADSSKVAALMAGARLLIARSGYSSLMDMAKVSPQNILLVPTPGQTEQEYLAETLAAKAWAQTQSQANLNVAKALERIGNSPCFAISFEPSLLEKAVENLLSSVKK